MRRSHSFALVVAAVAFGCSFPSFTPPTPSDGPSSTSTPDASVPQTSAACSSGTEKPITLLFLRAANAQNERLAAFTHDLAAACKDLATATSSGKSLADDDAVGWCNAASDGLERASAGRTVTIQGYFPRCAQSPASVKECAESCGPGSCDVNSMKCDEGPMRISCSGTCVGDGSYNADAGTPCIGHCLGACDGKCKAPSGGTVKCNTGSCDGSCTDVGSFGTCECAGTCSSEPSEYGCEGICTGICKNGCDGTWSAVTCDGECKDGAWSPIGCERGLLHGGCNVSTDCEHACTALSVASAPCDDATVTVNAPSSATPLVEPLQRSLPVLLKAYRYSDLFGGFAGLVVAAREKDATPCEKAVDRAAEDVNRKGTELFDAVHRVLVALTLVR